MGRVDPEEAKHPAARPARDPDGKAGLGPAVPESGESAPPCPPRTHGPARTLKARLRRWKFLLALPVMLTRPLQGVDAPGELRIAAPRPSITFLMGVDEGPDSPMYATAERFFREDPQERTPQVLHARSLHQVRDLLDREARPGTGPWGVVNLVVHAGPCGDLDLPVEERGPAAHAESLARPSFAPLGDALLDARSEIRIHACGAGRDLATQRAISRALGGGDPQRPLVRASIHDTVFRITPSGEAVREVSQAWSILYLPGAFPGVEGCLRRLERKHPRCGIQPGELRAALGACGFAEGGEGPADSDALRVVEGPVSFTWTRMGSGVPGIAPGPRGALGWARRQEGLVRWLAGMGLQPDELLWEVKEVLQAQGGARLPALQALGLARRLIFLRPFRGPQGQPRPDWDDPRCFAWTR